MSAHDARRLGLSTSFSGVDKAATINKSRRSRAEVRWPSRRRKALLGAWDAAASTDSSSTTGLSSRPPKVRREAHSETRFLLVDNQEGPFPKHHARSAPRFHQRSAARALEYRRRRRRLLSLASGRGRQVNLGRDRCSRQATGDDGPAANRENVLVVDGEDHCFPPSPRRPPRTKAAQRIESGRLLPAALAGEARLTRPRRARRPQIGPGRRQARHDAKPPRLAGGRSAARA